MEFESVCSKVEELAAEIRDIAQAIPLYMKGSSTFYHRLKLSAREIEKLGRKLKKAAQLIQSMAVKYQRWDEQTYVKK